MLDLLFNLNDSYTPPRKKEQGSIEYQMDMVLNTAKSNFFGFRKVMGIYLAH